MKKFTLLTLLAIGFHFAHAQVKKGDKLLGWTLGGFQSKNHFANPQNQDVKQEGIGTRLSLGVATKENLVLGVGLSYASSTQRQGNTKNENRSYGADVFLRKYYPVGKGFSIFTEGDAGYSFSRNRNVNPNSVSKSDGYTIEGSIQPGLAYNLTKRFQLEVALPDLVRVYYSHGSYQDPFNSLNSNSSTSYGISSSLGTTLPLAVGFRIIL